MRKWPLTTSVLMLVVASVVLHSLSHAEPTIEKRPFSDFPLTIAGRWDGRELGIDREILDVLKLTDYMMRVYVPRKPLALEGPSSQEEHRSRQVAGTETETIKRAPVWLYVGYYSSQKTGSTYHSPRNCLPGAGWQFAEAKHVGVDVAGFGRIKINKVLVQKGSDMLLILYWYHDRGRVIADEYWAKGYLIWDAMTKNRTDGALVRISVPVVSTTQAAYGQALAFLDDIWPFLQEFTPSEGPES